MSTSKSALSKKAIQSAATRGQFVSTARVLFGEQGYLGTSTELILSRMQVSKGALYHHFRDKEALFRAVCEQVHEEMAKEIALAARNSSDSWSALKAGCVAFLRFTARPDVRRILVIDAPSVLGPEEWHQLNRRFGFGLLQKHIEAAMAAGNLATQSAEELAVLLDGAMHAGIIWAAQNQQDTKLTRIEHAFLWLLDSIKVHR